MRDNANCHCFARARTSAVALTAAVFVTASGYGGEVLPVRPILRLHADEAVDQDDMCVWVNRRDPALSTVITSDKAANAIFVYDLDGNVLQRIPAPKPGNIDIRQGVKLNDDPEDLVVVNQRKDGFRLLAFRVDPASRKLDPLGGNPLVTGPNYGGCLYHSRKTGRLYFVCTSDRGTVEQHELSVNGAGEIQNQKVRSWQLGKCEGAVADDETGNLFIAEESRGVWKLGAEPDDATPGELIIRVGEHGLRGDVEGLAIARESRGGGVLLVSDQGGNHFLAYALDAPHGFLAEITVEGAQDSDGIEVTTANLGPKFPHGLFVCHTDIAPRPILITPWPDVSDRIR
jgi:3-phytase